MTEYIDMSELRSLGEDFTLESLDYDPSGLTPPGNYVTPNREIRLAKVEDGIFSFEVTFSSGFHTEDGRTYRANQKYPVRTRISTKQFEDQFNPGKTSQVSLYLRACGFNPKGMSGSQIEEALLESQAIPVRVYVGRTDRSVKDEAGEWSQKRLKTNQFNLGTKAEPVWVSELTIDGITYRATEKIGSFSRL